MISTFDIAKAFRDQLATVTTLTIVTEGQEFTPSPSADYVKEFLLTGAVRTVGMENTSSDDTSGIYQIDVSTRISNGKWANLAICDQISSGFPKGRHLSRNGIDIVTLDVSKSGASINGTHITHSLSIRYRVIK